MNISKKELKNILKQFLLEYGITENFDIVEIKDLRFTHYNVENDVNEFVEEYLNEGGTNMNEFEYEKYSNEEMSDLLTEKYNNKTIEKIECLTGLMRIHFTDESTLTIEVENVIIWPH